MLMICNKSGKTSGCKTCPEAKPHEPLATMLPKSITVEKSFCMGDKSLVEVKLIKAR